MKRIVSDEKKNNIKNNLIIILLILACMSLFYYLFHTAVGKVFDAAMAVFVPALVALFISYICEPFYMMLVNKCHLKKPIAVGITAILLVALIVVIFGFVGKFVYDQTINFINKDWPNILNWIDAWAKDNGYGGVEKIIADLRSGAIDFIGKSETTMSVLAIVKAILFGLKNFIVNIALTFIFFLYFLYSRGKIFKGIIKILPARIRGHVYIICSRSDDVIHSFVKGKFVAILFLIIYFIVGFEVIGLKGVGIIFAIILGLLDIIPIVGPIVGTAFPMFYTFILKADFWPGIWTPFLVLGIVLLGQFLQEKVISPNVIGKQMNINSLLLLASMVFFSSLFGVLGIILAIPICGIIKVVYTYLKETLFVDSEEDGKKDLSERISEKLNKKNDESSMESNIENQTDI